MLGGALLASGAVMASDASPVTVVASNPRFAALIQPGAQAQVLTADAQWAEGPLCLTDGRLIWSDVKANKVMSWKEHDGVTVWLDPAHYQNGMLWMPKAESSPHPMAKAQ
ncbi:Gluconolactonase [Pseudomonas savastanoi pv. glycinea]|nr:Gluconolactonase [Pseudomonas savastanoi pv. glycinea]